MLLQRKGHLDRSVADMLHLLTTQDPGHLSAHLKILSAQELADYLKRHAPLLDALKQLQLGRVSTEQIISDHHDKLVALETGYGAYSRPEDYLDAFRQFITDNRNKIAALDIVMTRPRKLTREHLRELQVALAANTFTERMIGNAWKQAKDQDIAATLIGYIRQLALGSPLIPFEIRVDNALKKVLAS